ncbi:MAG TPA: PilZ domain-containing protein [Candidatus Methylomirabilis sp.]
MERVIHHFPAQDDSEISLVMVVDGGRPRIEWRRYRRQATGNVVAEDRFPIRLAWIPDLIEGLLRAEASFRDMMIEVEGWNAQAQVHAAETVDLQGTTVVVVPDPAARPPEGVALAGAVSPATGTDPSSRATGRFPRYVIRSPLIVAVQSKDLTSPRILTGDAVDISWGGIQAHLPSKLQPGTVLEVLLGLGGKKALKLPARVVWGRSVVGLGQPKPHGLEFLPADPRLRQLVEQYLTHLAEGTPTDL